MKPDEPIPKRKRKAAKSTDTKPTGNKDQSHPESKSVLTSNHQTDARVSGVVDDKVLRARGHGMINEKPPPPDQEGYLKKHIVPLIIGFLLSGVPTGLLTHFLSVRQKDLEIQRLLEQQKVERRQRISEDMNKKRLDKVVEVWEQLDKTESEIDRILEKYTRGTRRPQSEIQKDVQSVHELGLKQSEIIKNNRIWLVGDDEIFDQIKKYLEISGRYATERLTGLPGIDLSDTLNKRAQAKQNIVQIMDIILNKESTPDRSSKQSR